MSESQAIRDDAGERFEAAAGWTFEDTQQRRLRYHPLRLTVAGLGHDEIRPLVELGRLAFDGADVTELVRVIRERPGATQLASALASIVDRGLVSIQFASRADVLIGAVTGAYAAMMNAGSDDGAPPSSEPSAGDAHRVTDQWTRGAPVLRRIVFAFMPRSFSFPADGTPSVNEDYLESVVLTSEDPQVVTYDIQPHAVWSDGTRSPPPTWWPSGER